MANIFRRQPGTLLSDNFLIEDTLYVDAASLIANEYFEAISETMPFIATLYCGVIKANIKTINDLAISSVKTYNGFY